VIGEERRPFRLLVDRTGVLGGVQAAARRLRRCERGTARSLDPACARLWRKGGVKPAWGAGRKGTRTMALIVADLSIQLIETLRPLMPRIKARDKNLAEQIQRAASSVVLNIGEAEYSDPGNRRARFHSAAGSAGETRAAVRLAVAWGIVKRADGEPATALLNRILPMLWKLTRG